MGLGLRWKHQSGQPERRLGSGTAQSNIPGGRHEAVGWADANGNLWLFGGEGEDSVGTANGILNDLWVYNIASNQWTYVMG